MLDKKLIGDVLELTRRTCRFWFVIYYVITLSFRLSFLEKFNATKVFYDQESRGAVVIDYLVDAFFLIDFVFLFRNYYRNPTDYSHFEPYARKSRISTQVLIVDADSTKNIVLKKPGRFTYLWRATELAFQIVLVFPFEAVAFAAGMNGYEYLRLFRLGRLYYISHYWDNVCELLESYKIVTNAVLQRVCFLTVIMATVGHVAGCLFYALALQELRRGHTHTWLTVDELAELDPVTGGVIILKTLNVRYLRSLYWAIQTLDRVGFGDIVAHTQAETWFCIFFFYIAAFLIYVTIANLVMFVTNNDSSRTLNLLKIAKFDKYAVYRKLPPALTRKVKLYFAYNWHLLNGVDETQVLSELPTNISQQITQSIVTDLLGTVDAFKHFNRGLLNAISEYVETQMFSPGDMIIRNDTHVTGMYIISSGEVEVLSLTNQVIGVLMTGQSFGSKALDKDYNSAQQYRAKAFTEVLHLRGAVYRYMLKKYHITIKTNLSSKHNLLFGGSRKLNNDSLESSNKNNNNNNGDDSLTPPRVGLGGKSLSISRPDENSTSFGGFGSNHNSVSVSPTARMSIAAQPAESSSKKKDSPLKKIRQSFAVTRMSIVAPRVSFKAVEEHPEILPPVKKERRSSITDRIKSTIKGSLKRETSVRNIRLEGTITTLHRNTSIVAYTHNSKSIFRPDHPFRAGWDVLLLLCLLFYLSSVAFLLSDCIKHSFVRNWFGLLIASYVVDVIFLVDTIGKCTVFSYIDNGIVISKTSKIWRHFFTNNNILVVCLSVLPIDIIIAEAINDYRIIPVVRLLKLIHMKRFPQLLKNLEEVLHLYFNLSISFELSRFIVLYFILFQLTHWVGCLWQLTAFVSTDLFGYDTNWIVADKHSDFVHQEYDSLSHTVQYWRSIYWAVSVMSSLGFSDILTTNSVETITVINVMFFGYLLFNTLLGAIASLISNFNREKREFHAKVEKIKKLMAYKNIPADLETKILRYYEYLWTRYGGVNEAEVLNSLPKSLRADVANFVMGPLVARIPFFTQCSEQMQQCIVSLLQSRIFLDDDVVVTFGDIGKEMYIIERGRVAVTNAQRNIVYKILTNNDYIGESCLLEVSKRTASAYALGYVDTYFLSSDNFEIACMKYPLEHSIIINAINETLRKKELANTQLSKAITSTALKMEEVHAAAPLQTIDSFMGIRSSMVQQTSSGTAMTVTTSNTSAAGGVVTATDLERGGMTNNNNNNNNGKDEEDGEEDDAVSSINARAPSAAGMVSAAPSSSDMNQARSFNNLRRASSAIVSVMESAFRRRSSVTSTRASQVVRNNQSIISSSRKRATMRQQAQSQSRVLRWYNACMARLDTIIYPDSTYKSYWMIFIFMVIMYYVIIIPIRICMWINPLTLIIDYTFDLAILVDNFLHSSLFATSSGGEMLSKKEDIRLRYLHSSRIWVDALAAVPLDLIALIMLTKLSPEAAYFALGFLRLNKLLKVIIVAPYYEHVEQMCKSVNFFLFRFFELTIALLIITHWTACLFYLFGTYSGPRNSCEELHNAPGCEYLDTWIEMQIHHKKLPENGGSQWEILLRSYNWAFSVMTAGKGADVFGLNAKETIFEFVTMFCGFSISGAIIGSIMSVVSDANVETTALFRRIELLRAYLTSHHLPEFLIVSATGLLKHIATEEGALTISQDEIFSELPHSLKISIDTWLKTTPYLRKCPFFDFCSDEVLRGISSKLRVKLYAKTDKIITFGDLGHEMFFLESGTVAVMSGDGKTQFSTLEDGAFFGETGLFFKIPRGATVEVTSPFCVCAVLAKADLDHELRACDYDAEEVLESFKILQQSNNFRNAAVRHHLEEAKKGNTKLSRMMALNDSSQFENKTLLYRLRCLWSPESYLRAFWDTMGLVFLVYYTFSIPLYIAFFFGKKIDIYLHYIAFDFLIDCYWIADIVLKLYVFSFKSDLINNKLVTDGEAIMTRYKKGNFMIDCVSSIPLEFFALIPTSSRIIIFIARVNHLLRLFQMFHYSTLVEMHMNNLFGLDIGRSLSLFTKAGFLYVFLNHWLACIYFMIHRYSERHVAETYVTADGFATYDEASGEHDICNTTTSYCYARSFYFVLASMTTIGYGDVSPYTNSETVWDIVVAILGAYIAAVFMGFASTYFEDIDATGDADFKKKLRDIDHYTKFRKLQPQLRTAIITQYTHLWNTLRSVSGENSNLFHHLSESSVMEISMHLQHGILGKVGMLNELAYQVKRRFAAVLKPQIAEPHSYLYRAGDVGHSMFFISSGQVACTLSATESILDRRTIQSLRILLHKQYHYGYHYTKGAHLGEFALLSQSHPRADSALVEKPTEVYTLRKTDLWNIFMYMAIEDRFRLLSEIFCRIDDKYHMDVSVIERYNDDNPVSLEEDQISCLYAMSAQVVTAMDEFLVSRQDIERMKIGGGMSFKVTSQETPEVEEGVDEEEGGAGGMFSEKRVGLMNLIHEMHTFHGDKVSTPPVEHIDDNARAIHVLLSDKQLVESLSNWTAEDEDDMPVIYDDSSTFKVGHQVGKGRASMVGGRASMVGNNRNSMVSSSRLSVRGITSASRKGSVTGKTSRQGSFVGGVNATTAPQRSVSNQATAAMIRRLMKKSKAEKTSSFNADSLRTRIRLSSMEVPEDSPLSGETSPRTNRSPKLKGAGGSINQSYASPGSVGGAGVEMSVIQKALRDVRHNAELVEAYGGVNVGSPAERKPLLPKQAAAEKEDTVGFEDDETEGAKGVDDGYFRENHITKGSKIFGANDFVSIDELRDDNPVDEVIERFSPSAAEGKGKEALGAGTEGAKQVEEDHDEGEEGDMFDAEDMMPIDSMFLVAKAAPTNRK